MASYPRQSGYPAQPIESDMKQQLSASPPPYMQPAPSTVVPVQTIQFSEEDKELLRKNGIKMIVVYVIGIICFTIGLPLLINGGVQTAVGNFTGALSIAFISVGSVLLVIAFCMLVVGLILLGRIRADEAEMKAKRNERMQAQRALQYQTAYGMNT